MSYHAFQDSKARSIELSQQEQNSSEVSTTDNDSQSPVNDASTQNIVDIVSSYQKGNFNPLLHCYNHDLIPKDLFDNSGYHALHSAVAGNQIQAVLVMIDHFKIDVNLRSKSNQTPLMIAANYGYNELIKILCDRGADVNAQENTKFSALTYTVKLGFVSTFSYLLSQNADISVRDAYGCSLAHWAAYMDNVFMLKMLRRLGLDLNNVDFTGMTPLDRAIHAEAFNAVNYLIDEVKVEAPSHLNLDKVWNPDMREILRKKFGRPAFTNLSRDLFIYFQLHSQKITVGVYFALWIFSLLVSLHVVVLQGESYLSNLIFAIFGIYFLAYTYWYYMKSNETTRRTLKKRGYETLITPGDDAAFGEVREHNTRMNYGELSKIVQDERVLEEYDTESPGFLTFLHELAYLIHTEKFKEVARFNQKDYCPTCLIRRPNRSCHSEEENICVEKFHHYSYFLGRSVTQKDHYLYVVLLAKQMLLLSLFLVQLWRTYAPKVEHSVIYPLETIYWLEKEYGYVYSGFYTLILILWGYNLAFFVLELYGIARNITNYELFNGSRCSYLYRTKLDDRIESYVRIFRNPHDKGITENIAEYMNNIFH